ncbi:hypothetical protein [Gordonibacter sp. An230]|uniref:hypothetical protein n=1 Tax=Gordonibacter sp. An230 TaxID=1965592 RepID=UPI000B3AD4FF|nr:hypothetical protein [Gordonibacter sp. An230]
MMVGRNASSEPPREPEDGQERDLDLGVRSDSEGSSASLPNPQEVSDFKSARTLATVASIAGPVSVFIGGMPLSATGVVCAVIALWRFGRLAAGNTRLSAVAARLRRSSMVGLVVCAVAFALNAVAFFTLLPEIIQMVETGELGFAVGSGAEGVIEPNSTWG